MKKLLQINITANWGSHGKIAEGIGQAAIKQGWQSYIAYGRWANPSASNLFHIGNRWDEMRHGVASRLFDNHGLMSQKATKLLLQFVRNVNPDIVHLHNIHAITSIIHYFFNTYANTTSPWCGLCTTAGALLAIVPLRVYWVREMENALCRMSAKRRIS